MVKKTVINVKIHIWPQIDEQVLLEIYDLVWSQVNIQVRPQVRDQVWEQVWDGIYVDLRWR